MQEIDVPPFTDSASKWIEQQTSYRNDCIKRILEKGEVKHDDPTVTWIIASVEYDCNFAPFMTQGDVLERLELYIGLTASNESPSFVSKRLEVLVNALSRINCFIVNTDGLTDFLLLNRLETGILKEEIRFIPPTSGVHEFIDMQCGRDSISPVADRDSTLPRPNMSSPIIECIAMPVVIVGGAEYAPKDEQSEDKS